MSSSELTSLSKEKIDDLLETFKEDFGYVPHVGLELEWYAMLGTHNESELRALWLESGKEVVEERGASQYETAWDASSDVLGMIDDVETFRTRLGKSFKDQGMEVSFDSKPFAEQPGSALQVHVHLEDEAGGRVFEKRDEVLTLALAHALGGLMETMEESMPVFAPRKKDYARFVPKQHAPTTISWGGNNRTVALRIPLKTGSKCHIEHRVPGANANVAACVAVTLAGVLHGISNVSDCGPQIHGDASDAHYNLPKLPPNKEEALRCLCEGKLLVKWLGQDWVDAVIDDCKKA